MVVERYLPVEKAKETNKQKGQTKVFNAKLAQKYHKKVKKPNEKLQGQERLKKNPNLICLALRKAKWKATLVSTFDRGIGDMMNAQRLYPAYLHDETGWLDKH